jgi:hypothetical protein
MCRDAADIKFPALILYSAKVLRKFTIILRTPTLSVTVLTQELLNSK